MSSWVYLLSQFTPEALLFEALAICILTGGYAAFWLLRKRKFGVAGNEIPSGVIRFYLNELISDAEQMRMQLFGLLRTAGASMPGEPSVMPSVAASGGNVSMDPALIEKLSQLEMKMLEKDKAMQALLAEKARIEAELLQARQAKSAGGGASADIAPLQEKISSLEGKLAEYSVIEDDLANLKRLQQENTQLKATLAQHGVTIPTGASASAAAPAPAAATEAPARTQASAAPAGANTAVPAAAAAVAAAATEAPPAAAKPDEAPASNPLDALIAADSQAQAAAPEAAFEGLVDQVEQSLATAPAAEAPAPTESSTSEKPAGTIEKSDEDLVAEFEKMLSS